MKLLFLCLSSLGFFSPSIGTVTSPQSPDWIVLCVTGSENCAVVDDGVYDCVRTFTVDPTGGPFGDLAIRYSQTGDC